LASRESAYKKYILFNWKSKSKMSYLCIKLLILNSLITYSVRFSLTKVFEEYMYIIILGQNNSI
jgi:hypothetical protein